MLTYLSLLAGFLLPPVDSLPAPPPLPPAREKVVELICVREQMPVYPGCEEIVAYTKRKRCGDGLLLEYIYGNLVYPAEARAARIEGMAVISFVIEKDGRMTEPRVLRDPGCGTGQAALDVVQRMVDEGVRWEPGRAAYGSSQAVRVQFNLPVKFKLE